VKERRGGKTSKCRPVTYSLEFHEDALKEWNDLDGSIKSQLKQLESAWKIQMPSAR
jgi:mRNA-degrading endonuclease RelE of RelBE toxin-antitoxin system